MSRYNFDSLYRLLSLISLKLIYKYFFSSQVHFVKKLYEFSIEFTSLKLNDIEIGLICAIILTSVKDSNLIQLIDAQAKQNIDKINDDLNEALYFEIRNRLGSSSSSPTLNKAQEDIAQLLDKVNESIEQLNLIGLIHNQQIQFYRQHKHKMKLPHILSEIYEIENGSSKNLASISDTSTQRNNLQTSHGDSNYISNNNQIVNQPTELCKQSPTQNGQYIIHLNENGFNRLGNNNANYQYKPELDRSTLLMQPRHHNQQHQISQQDQMLLIQPNQAN